MELLFVIIFTISIAALIYSATQFAGRITKHLKVIRLQLEIQNPMFVSEQLLDLDKHIEYWQEKMFKYKDDMSEENKEIQGLTFDLFWAYLERLNHYRVMIVEAKQTGSPNKIHDKYRKWLEENEERIHKMEKKVMEINPKIKEDLDKRNIDYEFSGKWNAKED